MKVIIATDSFKGSLTSIQSGNAISEGIKRLCNDIEIEVRPIANTAEQVFRIINI